MPKAPQLPTCKSGRQFGRVPPYGGLMRYGSAS